MSSAPRPRILFLCTGNSSRSQMAEGLLRARFGDRYEALSAGSHPAGYVHPLAIEAMRDMGIDITNQRSKSIDEFLPPAGHAPDVLISVCDAADHECPAFPANVERLHWPFRDPGHVRGTPEERLDAFRAVRDQIAAAIENHFGDDGSHIANSDEAAHR